MMKFLRFINRDPDPADPAAPAAGGDPKVVDPAADPKTIPTNVVPIPTDPQSQQATIPAASDPAAAADDKKYSFFETVPADLKDKPYMKGVQNFDQLYKSLDGAQELIGKKASGIPAKEASAEEHEAFAKSWGRPDKSEEYTTPDIKLPEGVEKNAELDLFAKGLFHKAGLNQDQVNVIQGGYEAKMLEMMGKLPDAAAQDAEFETMTTELFKDRKDEVLANGNLLLAENTPEALKEAVAGLDNKSLMIMSAVLDSVRAKYISEDVMPTDSSIKGGGETVDELRQQARVLMAKKEYLTKSHKDHAVVKEEVDGIYTRIARLESMKK